MLNKFAKKFKKIRLAHQMSGNEIEKKAGLSNGNISRIERGVQWPSEQTLYKLAEVMGVHPVEFFIEDDAYARGEAPKRTSAKRMALMGIGTPEKGGVLIIEEQPPNKNEFLYSLSLDPKAYGIRINGDLLRPRIKNGEVIIIEPSADPRSGDDILVRLFNQQTLIKELLWIRDNQLSLGSINGDSFSISIPLKDIESVHRVASIMPCGSCFFEES